MRTVAEAQAALAEIGYGIPSSGMLDEETRAALIAFQQHFRPARCNGELDAESGARLSAVAETVRQSRQAG